ncbi:hypothetical protein QOZ80_5AG0380930 [Eleusine coracana subsp. coracana]|nr:hypothetical protein QOZ80_5AG0380930 [Eleusine coracana subsp. coracana]
MEPAPEAGSLSPLTNHLLEDILVRIDTRADLARASASCKAFRRLVTDPAFLRRHRALHPPLILGFVNVLSADGFVPAESPHLNAPAARAFAAAADFSVDHIMPRRCYGWRLCDARDGRVLLMPGGCVPGLVSPELAVFDPLTRGNKKMLKLNLNSIQFTTVSLPPDHQNRSTMFVEAGEGRVGMFSLIRRNPQPLRYSVWQNESENAHEHPVETIIPLPHEYDWYTFEGAAHGYVFLTMKVERVCLSNIHCASMTAFMSPRML